MPFRLARALRTSFAAVRKNRRPARPSARCAPELLENRRLLTVSIDTPYDAVVEGYSAAFVADFSADARPTSASAN